MADIAKQDDAPRVLPNESSPFHPRFFFLSRFLPSARRADSIPEESCANEFHAGRNGEIAQFFLAF